LPNGKTGRKEKEEEEEGVATQQPHCSIEKREKEKKGSKSLGRGRAVLYTFKGVGGEKKSKAFLRPRKEEEIT